MEGFLPKAVSAGSCVNYPRPDSNYNLPCIVQRTGRNASPVKQSSLSSRKSARFALRMRQIDEDRAIQQRQIELEKRALALERKILAEKYRLLEQKIRKKSASKNKSETRTDDLNTTMQSAVLERAAPLETQIIPSTKPICVPVPDCMKMDETQLRITRAFLETDLMRSNLAVDSLVRSTGDVISLAPLSSSSEFNSEDIASGTQQMLHSIVQQQAQMCVSSIEQLRVKKFSCRVHSKRNTDTKWYRTTNKTVCFHGLQRIMVRVFPLPLYELEETCHKSITLGALKALTAMEQERKEPASTLSEARSACLNHLDPDTGQEYESLRNARSDPEKIKTNFDQISLFCFGLALRYNHRGNMFSFLFVGCENEMLQIILNVTKFSNDECLDDWTQNVAATTRISTIAVGSFSKNDSRTINGLLLHIHWHKLDTKPVLLFDSICESYLLISFVNYYSSGLLDSPYPVKWSTLRFLFVSTPQDLLYGLGDPQTSTTA
ncbi:uncharacterized protein LOC115260805 isoform X1 [Aedes albopictus]|uniref:Uncharacterized protein n=1 Tax=Aedes albopictus TaxID=7160 RepID=A0ABM1XP47_AEDAL